MFNTADAPSVECLDFLWDDLLETVKIWSSEHVEASDKLSCYSAIVYRLDEADSEHFIRQK